MGFQQIERNNESSEDGLFKIDSMFANRCIFVWSTDSGCHNIAYFILFLTDDQSWVGSSLCIDPDDKSTCSDYYQTPNVERLASLGMRFTRGYAPAPYCSPTRRSIQIGQSSARHLDQKDQPGWTEYYKKQPTIPQALKAIDPNYRTAHFGKLDFRYDGISPDAIGYDISDGPTTNSEGVGKLLRPERRL